MSRCKHDKGNIQQFTEICLDCGHNIYETDEQYEKSLHRDIAYLKEEIRKKNIELLEMEKDKLSEKLRELKGEDDDSGYRGSW